MGTLDITSVLDNIKSEERLLTITMKHPTKKYKGSVRCFNGEKNLIALSELGKLALITQLCYWGYEYADGDCQEGKCERNELCRMKGKVCK